MICPYCNQEMTAGDILGCDRALRWLPKDKHLLLGLYAFKSMVLVSNDQPFNRPHVNASYCKQCKKIIIDAPS